MRLNAPYVAGTTPSHIIDWNANTVISRAARLQTSLSGQGVKHGHFERFEQAVCKDNKKPRKTAAACGAPTGLTPASVTPFYRRFLVFLSVTGAP
jgi:hypothetical protein